MTSVKDTFDALANAKMDADELERKKQAEADKKVAGRLRTLVDALSGEQDFFDSKGVSIDKDAKVLFLNHAQFVIGCDCAQEPMRILLGRRKRTSGLPEFDTLNVLYANDVSEAKKAIAKQMHEAFNSDSDKLAVFSDLDELR